MNFQIKHRFSGAVLFSLETGNLKLCLETAVNSRADLGGADLRGAYLGGADLGGAYLGGADLGGADLGGADLGGADLRGADLGGAYLGGAYLRGAKIADDITVAQSPVCVQGLEWFVTIWDNHMQIGCEFHSQDEWRNFSDEDWARMGGKEAVKLCREHKAALLAFCDVHAAKAEKIKHAEETDNG